MSLQLIPRFKYPTDIKEYFCTQEICHDFLEQIRWSNGVFCPHCGNTKSIGWLNERKNFKCYKRGCHKFFTVTTGTLFHSGAASKLPSWFTLLAYFIREDFSSITWSGQMKVTQPNAWMMVAKLKMALCYNVKKNKLRGIVQVDETFIGGDPQKNLRLSKRIRIFKNMQEEIFGKTAYKLRKENGKKVRGRKPGSKNSPKGFPKPAKLRRFPYGHRTAILGMHEPGGRTVYIVLGVDKNSVDKKKIYALLQEYIEPTAIVMTDDAPHYKKLNTIFPNHQIIRHKRKKTDKEIENEKKEIIEQKEKLRKLINPEKIEVGEFRADKLYSRKAYINGDLTIVTTNAIEARWKYIKLGYNLRCSYTREHMPGYLAEAAWRKKRSYSSKVLYQRFIELVEIALSFKTTSEEIKQFGIIEFDNPYDPDKPIKKRVRRFKSSSDFLVIISINKFLNEKELILFVAA